MIEDCEQVWGRLTGFAWKGGQMPLEDKVGALKGAIVGSLRREGADEIHVALSGGVDSSLVVVLLRSMGRRVVAHTIAGAGDHPDMAHAELVATQVGAVWVPHIIIPQPSDLVECVADMGPRQRVDNYWYLFRAISQSGVGRILTCDCIDELLGGYYAHSDPGMFAPLLRQLIPNHLEQLDKASTRWGISVRLPYAEPEVLDAASAFGVDELVGLGRKQPIYTIAREVGVPSAVLIRRKYGLVSAMNLDEGRPKVVA